MYKTYLLKSALSKVESRLARILVNEDKASDRAQTEAEGYHTLESLARHANRSQTEDALRGFVPGSAIGALLGVAPSIAAGNVKWLAGAAGLGGAAGAYLGYKMPEWSRESLRRISEDRAPLVIKKGLSKDFVRPTKQHVQIARQLLRETPEGQD